MESQSQKEQRSTDPQQHEIDGNVLGKPFESHFGDTKGRQEAEEDQPGASQTGGVEDEGQNDEA